jgi:tetratricopeptide (TPR) repeat protein
MNDSAAPEDTRKEGLRLFHEGLYSESIAAFEQARAAYDAAGDQTGAAEMVNNLGVVYRMNRQWHEAARSLEEARALFHKLGDQNRESQALGNLGGLYASMGKRDKARECLRQAADNFAELGDSQRQGETLMALGVQVWRSGDRREGTAVYRAGLETLQRPALGHKVLRATLGFLEKLTTHS